MNSRRNFFKAIAAIPAALALVDLRKVVPNAPVNAKAYGASVSNGKQFIYVRAGNDLHMGDLVRWSADGKTVVRTAGVAGIDQPIAGIVVADRLTEGHFGFIQVAGVVEANFRR